MQARSLVRRSCQTKRVSRYRKLLQFHENYRPPWWGICPKISTIINGRQNPSLIHNNTTRHRYIDTNLNYDIESDDEWDEPEDEDGENIDDIKDNDTDDDNDNDSDIKCKDAVADMVNNSFTDFPYISIVLSLHVNMYIFI